MLKTFQEIGLNQKGNNPTELGQWFKDYIAYSKNGQQDVKPKVPPLSLTSDGTGTTRTQSTTSSPYPPKVRIFSCGDNRGEMAYDIWRYEVKMLKDSGYMYTREQKEYAICRSLTGSAARMVMFQGLDAPLSEVLETLYSVYGSVNNKEQLLLEFYSSKQREDEDVSAWSNRLEDIIGKGLEKGEVRHTEVNSMLHGMLWMGLGDDLKDINGHKHDTIKDFNKLRIALRQLEKDHKKLQGQHQQQFRGNNFRGRGNYRASYNNRGWRNNGPPRQQQNGTSRQYQRQDSSQDGGTGSNTETVYCYRCYQPGHIQIGCRVRLDHIKRPLNWRKPGRRSQY